MGLTSELLETAIESESNTEPTESWPLVVGLGIIIVVVFLTVIIVRTIFKYLKRAKDKIREKV